MENVPEVYSDVSIRDWANNIRQIKIRELQEIVTKKQREFDAYVVMVSPPNRASLNTALEGLVIGLDLLKLKFKLTALTKK